MTTNKTNVLIALENILSKQLNTLPIVLDSLNNNRINSQGDLLEYYVKDAFCSDALPLTQTKEKLQKYQELFSYLGNSNNPPDFIIKEGPAIEVKKIESKKPNVIALNSSFPKNFLYSDDSKISKACRTCEDDIGGWNQKDMIYAIGNVTKNQVHSLWLIYGDCYCADRTSYQRVANSIKTGVNTIPGVNFAETNELGRVNRVDPLGITYLRIRGMWGIEHPENVFRSWLEPTDKKTRVYILMRKSTYLSLTPKPDFTDFIKSNILKINEIQIPNPDNPAKIIDAIFFSGSI